MRKFAPLLSAFLAASLVACASLPGAQTVGIASDPDATTKQVLVAAGLMIDAVGVYGKLPPCELKVEPCRSEKAYSNAKLIATSVADGFQSLRNGSQSSLLLTAGLVYAQYTLAKTLSAAPGPTDPNAPPAAASVAYIQALGLADVLVNTADARIRDAASPNVTVVELLDDLSKKVAALP